LVQKRGRGGIFIEGRGGEGRRGKFFNYICVWFRRRKGMGGEEF
jgi:hypothetical protein